MTKRTGVGEAACLYILIHAYSNLISHTGLEIIIFSMSVAVALGVVLHVSYPQHAVLFENLQMISASNVWQVRCPYGIHRTSWKYVSNSAKRGNGGPQHVPDSGYYHWSVRKFPGHQRRVSN